MTRYQTQIIIVQLTALRKSLQMQNTDADTECVKQYFYFCQLKSSMPTLNYLEQDTVQACVFYFGHRWFRRQRSHLETGFWFELDAHWPSRNVLEQDTEHQAASAQVRVLHGWTWKAYWQHTDYKASLTLFSLHFFEMVLHAVFRGIHSNLLTLPLLSMFAQCHRPTVQYNTFIWFETLHDILYTWERERELI